MMQKLTQFVPKGVTGMEPSEFEVKEEVLSRIKQLFKKKGSTKFKHRYLNIMTFLTKLKERSIRIK